MCKVLALSALLANSNTKASAIARVNTLLPDISYLISLSTIGVIRDARIIIGLLAASGVSLCFWPVNY